MGLAIISNIMYWTLASIIVDSIGTSAAVETRVRAAIVYIGLAVVSFIACCALASIAIDFIRTGAAVETGVKAAIVYIDLAVVSCIARIAHTEAGCGLAFSILTAVKESTGVITSS